MSKKMQDAAIAELNSAVQDPSSIPSELMQQLYLLSCKKKFTGRTATVKPDTKWVYAGHSLKVMGIYSVNWSGYGVYEDGSCHLQLSLDGTEWLDRGYTVINEKDLIFNPPN
jgi:hypothetical protein